MTICQWWCTSVGDTCIGRLNPIGPCSQSSIYTSIIYIYQYIYQLYIAIYTSIAYIEILYIIHYVGRVSGQSTVFAPRWHEDSIARLGWRTWHFNIFILLGTNPVQSNLDCLHFIFFLRSTCWSLAWQGWKEEAYPSNILWWETS